MAPVIPGSCADTGGALNVGVTVLTWAIESIMDLPSRHDAWLHVSNVCKREADRVVEKMKHQARLNLERPEPRRPPSGHFAAARAELANAMAPTKQSNVTALLAMDDPGDEEETKP